MLGIAQLLASTEDVDNGELWKKFGCELGMSARLWRVVRRETVTAEEESGLLLAGVSVRSMARGALGPSVQGLLVHCKGVGAEVKGSP